MNIYALILACLFVAVPTTYAAAEQNAVEKSVLTNRLNNLESQAIQRRGKGATTLDLLNNQDNKIAGQALNRLKTKRPRSDIIPRLERKLDGIRRPGSRFGRR